MRRLLRWSRKPRLKPHRSSRVNWVDDLKVALASLAGLGNWMLQVDLLLKISISLVSLLYVTKKCVDLYRK